MHSETLGTEGPVRSTTTLNVWVLTAYRLETGHDEVLCVSKTLSEIERAADHNNGKKKYRQFKISQMPVWE